MANTYSQVYIHLIFCVNKRESLLNKEIRDRLFRFINSQINSDKQKLLSINGHYDHIHILFSINPDIAISRIVQELKINTSKFLKSECGIKNFSWQKGYGAFSYSKSQIDKVRKYIRGQEKHHKLKSFKEEYEGFLKAFEIDYNPKYVFEYIKLEESV